MAKVFPFKGIIYNKKRVKNLSRVITPPYDVISEQEQDDFYEISDYNIIRLILGKEFPGDSQYNNKYVRAAAFFEGWLRHNVLIQDEKPAIYYYEQIFSFNKKKYKKAGFIALLRLEDFGRGKVFPHEETFARPKLDRLMLIRTGRANFECIYGFYSDVKEKVISSFKKFKRRKPILEFKTGDKVLHRIWRVDSKSVIKRIHTLMKDKPVFIADGHHRYEASLRFKSEMKERNTKFSEDEAYNHIMMYFSPIEGEGMIILPIHRLIKVFPEFEEQKFFDEINRYFEIKRFPFSKRSREKIFKKALKEKEKNVDKHVFLLYFSGKKEFLLLTLKSEEFVNEVADEEKPLTWKELDVTILHSVIFNRILNIQNGESIKYVKDELEALELIDKGEYTMAFFLNPTKSEQIIDLASHYLRLPHKSTYFFPKVPSGITINKINHGEKVGLE